MRLNKYLQWWLSIIRKEFLLPIITILAFSIEEQKVEADIISETVSVCDSTHAAPTDFPNTIYTKRLIEDYRDTQSIITDMIIDVKVNTSVTSCPSAPCNGVWDGNN